MIRVILCRVRDKPRVDWLGADPGGGHAATLGRMLGVPIARLPLHDGVELCCDRDALLYGLALARRVLRSDSPERALGPDMWPDLWPVCADFLLARATTAGGELVDLTMDDVRFWMFWLGLDYILNR